MIAVASFFAIVVVSRSVGLYASRETAWSGAGTKGLVAEINLWRCCSVRWEPHIRCARFAEV